jgi:type VI secretion system protein ImpC
MEFQTNLGSNTSSRRRAEDAPRRFLVLGEFADSSASTSQPARERSVVAVDPYDIDAAIKQLSPAFAVDPDDPGAILSLRSLDDFHPDALCKNLPQLLLMTQLRDSLSKPGQQSDAAIAAVQEILGERNESDKLTSTAVTDPAGESFETDDDTVARLLGRARGADSAGQRTASSTVQRLVAEATESASIVDSELVTKLGSELEGLMTQILREVLSTTAFQQIESSWRSIRWLADHMDVDTECDLSVFDLSFGQLRSIVGNDATAADLKIHVARQWRQRIADEAPSLIVAMYPISHEPDGLVALRWLMDLAAELSAPLVAGADASLAGLDTGSLISPYVDASDLADVTDEEWTALRGHPGATNTAIGFPPFVLRQPYGQKSDPIETFRFEELPARPDSDAFLWASSSMALAVAWMRTQAGVPALLEDMPMVVYEDGSGQAIMPPTKHYLSDSAAAILTDKGLTPLRANRNTTDIKVQRLVPFGETRR